MGILSQMISEPDPDFRCQVCGGAEFLEGPHGGDAINFACKECFARYNAFALSPLTRMTTRQFTVTR